MRIAFTLGLVTDLKLNPRVMIETIFLYHQEVNFCMKEDKESPVAILALTILGAPIPFQSIWTYLTLKELASQPQIFSPWVHLQSVWNDQALTNKMGIDELDFEMLLIHFSNSWCWNSADPVKYILLSTKKCEAQSINSPFYFVSFYSFLSALLASVHYTPPHS